ncbi:hypothetical protein LCGC14_2922410, partial [marine sediment metagenome]
MQRILYFVVYFIPFVIFAQEPSDLKLWYDEPAGEVWENALPIGNGRIGAMVYGNVSKEIFQLNEHTVWSGSPNRNDNPNALKALPEVRQLIFDGEYKAAEELANEKIISKKSQGQIFQPVGNLELTFSNQEKFEDYYRDLDIGNATSRTSYTANGVTYIREAFVSLADRVLIIKLSTDRPGKISFTANFTSPHTDPKIVAKTDHEISLWGKTSDHEGIEGKVKFNALMRMKTTNGKSVKRDNAIRVDNADEVVLMVSIASNFNSYKDLNGDEMQRAKEYLETAFAKEFPQLKAEHIKKYQNLFNRVKLDFGTTDASKLPTDERLANFRNTVDPSFVALYFQYGRYLLISSSQPGG